VARGQPDLPKRSSVGAQLVVHRKLRRHTGFPEQLSHQADCGFPVAATLNQQIEHLAFIVDRAPQAQVLATDPPSRRDATAFHARGGVLGRKRPPGNATQSDEVSFDPRLICRCY